MSKTETALTASASISAENTFTSAVGVGITSDAAYRWPPALVSISISGTWVATVTLQRRLDETNWRVVKTYTANAEETYSADEACDLRIGVATGDYTSGTVVVRLGQGG